MLVPANEDYYLRRWYMHFVVQISPGVNSDANKFDQWSEIYMLRPIGRVISMFYGLRDERK